MVLLWKPRQNEGFTEPIGTRNGKEGNTALDGLKWLRRRTTPGLYFAGERRKRSEGITQKTTSKNLFSVRDHELRPLFSTTDIMAN